MLMLPYPTRDSTDFTARENCVFMASKPSDSTSAQLNAPFGGVMPREPPVGIGWASVIVTKLKSASANIEKTITVCKSNANRMLSWLFLISEQPRCGDVFVD